jgi:hypothetical protein
MYAYRPTILPQRMPAHPGYKAPTGPLATTLPQRAGMATQGPVQLGGRGNQSFGTVMPDMPYQGGAGYQRPPSPGPMYGAGLQGPPQRGPFDVPIERSYITPGERQQAINAFGHAALTPPVVTQRRTRDQVAADPVVQRRRANRIMQQDAFTQGFQYATPAEWTGNMQAGVDRDRMYDAAAGSGPYDGATGMAHFGPLQSRPAPTMTPPPMGPFGRSRLVDVDGRQVGFGPNASVGDYANTPEGQAGARGVNGVYVDTMGTPNAANQAYAARAADRTAGLREGRRNRAIAKHGLTWLQPTNNYAYDSRIGGVGGYTRQSPLTMPPSMQSNGGEEAQVASRVQQVQDFSRANPNATLADYERAGFSREDVELAHAAGSTPHLMDQATQDPFLAGMLGSMLGPLTAVGVGPLSPVAQERRRQRQQGNARIGTVVGRPAAPQRGGTPSAFGRGVISALLPW